MAFSDEKEFGDLITASDYNALIDDLFTRIVGNNINEATADISANLPVPGEGDRVFIETDTGRTLYDTGSEFVEVGLSETQIDLSNLGSRAHSDLTGISPDDHHQKTTQIDDLDDVGGITGLRENTSGDLPSPGTEGRIFFETDTGRVLYDNGTSLKEIGLSEGQINLANLGQLGAGGRKITNLSDPTDASDAATKAFVDSVAQGLNLKDSVAVTDHDQQIDLTGSTDPRPIDGYTLENGERILLKHQNDATQNGIYDAVDASDPSTWVRSADFDSDEDVDEGSFAFVENGDVHGNEAYVVVSEDPITVGTDAINWTQFSFAGQIQAGDGLTRSGETLNVGLDIDDDGADVADAFGIDFAGGDFSVTDDGDSTVSVSLSDTSVSVAGNSVSLGGSTAVDYIDLSDTGTSFPIPNSDLSNSSVSVAGNSVSLGGSTNVDYIDLADTGTSFPIPNGDLSNSSISVAGNSVSLGGSVTPEVTDLSGNTGSTGQFLKTDGTSLSFENITIEETVTTSSNLTTSGQTTVFADVSGGPLTVTLASSDAKDGRKVRVVDKAGNASNNTIIVNTESSETINGQADAVVNSDFEAVTFQSDGSNWFVVSRMGGGDTV